MRARRIASLLALLRDGDACPADAWLAVLGGLSRAECADLRLGLRHLGAGRLGDVAGLVARDTDLPLPTRLGLRGGDEEEDGDIDDLEDAAGPAGRAGPADRGDGPSGDAGAARLEDATASQGGAPPSASAPRRRLRASLLARAIDMARRTRAALAGWPAHAPAGEHAARLSGLLADALGWDAAAQRELALEPARLASELEAALPPLAALAPGPGGAPGPPLGRDEFVDWLADRLAALQCEPVGGRGGGVAVLDVMEARARSFERLFVVGLNRGVFPRVPSEDALLRDALRRAVARDLLPDLPIKGTSHDEERYLFAQLVAAAPYVVLWYESTT